ncbi:hypothetical protein [Flagellimonas flava]|uniref:Uncharacterized protein n=1 Tax=Flagellimonas flava TaxID=570519 RepID=A0A1M5IL95_9FLAO|nr:hypothetical protein [Allomuricauda flava]SHG28543.1 hypothetical protein SAMN04488116_0755 [Allomuricauda flava]
MKKKYISYFVILILIGIAMNYVGIFGVIIWGMSKQIEMDKRYGLYHEANGFTLLVEKSL